MNPERLKKLQAQAEQVRIGGKGTESLESDIVPMVTRISTWNEFDGQTMA